MNQQGQIAALNGSHEELALEFYLGDDIGDQIDDGPQHFRVVDFSKDSQT